MGLRVSLPDKELMPRLGFEKIRLTINNQHQINDLLKYCVQVSAATLLSNRPHRNNMARLKNQIGRNEHLI